MHMVSAWVDELSPCFGQVVTEQKSNEITEIPMLLEMLEIKGTVVTLDAMVCQEKIVDKIIEKKAGYVITVKNNQPKLRLAIAGAFADAFEQYLEDDLKDKAVRARKYESRDRGRLAQRTVTVAPVPEAMQASGKWKNIKKTIGMVYRHREAFNTDNPRAISESGHMTCFISSLKPTASLVAKHLTKHWTVENKLHWTLDKTFKEVRSRIRKGSSPAIMGSLRRFALSLLNRDTSMPKTSLKRKRLRAALNTDKLEAVLFSV